MEQTEQSQFEQAFSYHFENKDLLLEALRHSSFVNERPDENLRDNERLEFLGDAVLDLVIGHILMQRYPDLKEGELSRMRAGLVNESRLAAIAADINLGAYIQLGKGELQTKGRKKKSILANTFEALIAAVYLDGGFDSVFKLIENRFVGLLQTITLPAVDMDFKTRLQERVQQTLTSPPVYHLIEESGPDHDKTFRIAVRFAALQAEGVGKSKKAAEQEAARKALEMLTDEEIQPSKP